MIRNDTDGHELYALNGMIGETENIWNERGNDEVNKDLMKRAEDFWSWG